MWCGWVWSLGSLLLLRNKQNAKRVHQRSHRSSIPISLYRSIYNNLTWVKFYIVTEVVIYIAIIYIVTEVIIYIACCHLYSLQSYVWNPESEWMIFIPSQHKWRATRLGKSLWSSLWFQSYRSEVSWVVISGQGGRTILGKVAFSGQGGFSVAGLGGKSFLGRHAELHILGADSAEGGDTRRRKEAAGKRVFK